MLPKKTRHALYAVLLLALFVAGTSAIANTRVYGFLSEFIEINDRIDALDVATEVEADVVSVLNTEADHATINTLDSAPMFMTIIQGADEEVICPNDGSTLAKFFLCGTSDIRTITLSQSGSSYQWQKLDPNRCALSVIEDCANTDNTCYDTVGTNATLSLIHI